MIEQLANFLETNGVGTIGKDIFKAHAPDSKVNCILITDTGGEQADQNVPLDNPTVQIMIRADISSGGYKKAMDKAKEIYALLDKKQNITIGNLHALYSRALQRPFSLGLVVEKIRSGRKGRGEEYSERKVWKVTTNYIFHIRGEIT